MALISKNKSLAIFQTLRFDKPVAAGLMTIAGEYIGNDAFSFSGMRAALTICLIVAFSFAINDLSDAPADKVNSPGRPLPSARVSKLDVVLTALLLCLSGLALSVTLGLNLFLFTILLIAASVSYSFWLKGTILVGNALVALMIASVLIFGAMAAGEVTSGVLIAFGLAFSFVFCQEILATIRDEKGDRIAGVKTMAVVLGRSKSLFVFKAVALLVAPLSIMPWVFGVASKPYLVTAVLCASLPILTVALITRSHSDEAVYKALTVMRYTSIIAFVPILLLR